jgi:hypothetical protein
MEFSFANSKESKEEQKRELKIMIELREKNKELDKVISDNDQYLDQLKVQGELDIDKTTQELKDIKLSLDKVIGKNFK